MADPLYLLKQKKKKRKSKRKWKDMADPLYLLKQEKKGKENVRRWAFALGTWKRGLWPRGVNEISM